MTDNGRYDERVARADGGIASVPYGWKFPRQWSDEGSSGGTAAEYALDRTLEGLVREIWQNLNDEGPIEDEQVKAVAKVEELTGDDRDEFLRNLGWRSEDSGGESLEEHLGLVTADDDATKRFLEQMEEEDRLVVLTVEDRNTRGLLGVGGEDKTFAGLVLDELENNTNESGGGGSYGLGSFTYQAWSGLSTVLYSSALSDPDPRDDDPRLYGRAYFPTHGDPDEDYVFQGDGFFGRLPEEGRSTVVSDGDDVLYKWGEDGGGQPESIWGDDASNLLSALDIPRTTEVPGTSVTIVGVSPPGRPDQPDPDEVGEEIARAVSKWFWPLIATGRLETTVETPSREIDVGVDYCDAVTPFVEAFRRRTDPDERLENPGDVAVEPRDIEIPDKSDGTSTADGPIDIVARLADPTSDGPESELEDKVALIRGAGMVVKYYDQQNVVYGDRHFHSLVLAGRARAWGDGEPTESDVDIDDYLKACEPPSHDDWNSNEPTINQSTDYGSGYLERVKDLKKEITAVLKHLVGGTLSEGELVAPELAKRLGIAGRGRPPESKPVIRAFDDEFGFNRDTGQWEFQSRVSPIPDDHYGWSVDVSLERLAKSGHSIDAIGIETLDCDAPDDLVEVEPTADGYHVAVDEPLDEIRIEGVSEPDENSGETRLDVTGEVVVGGEN